MLKKTLAVTSAVTLLGAAGSAAIGVPLGSVTEAAVVAGVSASSLDGAISDSKELTARDIVIALIPTVASALTAGLTMGWGYAAVGLITGPLASLLNRWGQGGGLKSDIATH